MPFFIQETRPENLKRSVDEILKRLRGTKRLDLFECARVDPNHPIEETIGEYQINKLLKGVLIQERSYPGQVNQGRKV